MEKFEKLDNEQKELVKYWIQKYKASNAVAVYNCRNSIRFIEKHLTPEPVIEAGFWYKYPNTENWMLFVEKSDSKTFGGYGFDAVNAWMPNWEMDSLSQIEGLVKVMPDEYKSRLFKEAAKRGFVKGAKFYPIFNEKEDVRKGICICDGNFFSNNPHNLSANLSVIFGQLIMRNGKWAEIIDEKAEIKAEIQELQDKLEHIKSKL